MIAVGALLAVYGVLALVDLRARVAASYASRVEYMRTLRALPEVPYSQRPVVQQGVLQSVRTSDVNQWQSTCL